MFELLLRKTYQAFFDALRAQGLAITHPLWVVIENCHSYGNFTSGHVSHRLHVTAGLCFHIVSAGLMKPCEGD